MSNTPINVMIVDDSILVRGLLRKIIESDNRLAIVATAADGESAVNDYKTYKPDIVLLDIEMPIMDGLTALDKIISFDPDAKVIMCSSLTQRGAEMTFKALDKGAVDYLSKPSSGVIDRTVNFEQELLSKVTALSKKSKQDIAPLERKETKTSPLVQDKSHCLRPLPTLSRQFPLALAVGASTGGPKALLEFFKGLDKKLMIPIFVTQHIPAGFSKFLVDNIEKNTGFKTHEAEEGMLIEPGHIYVAPGQKHLCVSRGLPKRIMLSDAEPVNFCKPAIDVMLDSLSDGYKGNILTVLLTGMGADGKNACKRMIEISTSNVVVAQDEESSVVWGIPGAVVKEGLCSIVAPLNALGDAVTKLIKHTHQEIKNARE